MDEFTYKCMIRNLLQYKARGRTDLIKSFLKRRENQKELHEEIVADCRDQWNKGNRGEKGKWL